MRWAATASSLRGTATRSPTRSPSSNPEIGACASRAGLRAPLRRAIAEAGLGDDTTQGKGGPGQYEITFEPADPLRAADHAAVFNHLTKALAQHEGYAASFMARLAEQRASSGGHLHLQLLDNDGRPLLGDLAEAIAAFAGTSVAAQALTPPVHRLLPAWRHTSATPAGAR